MRLLLRAEHRPRPIPGRPPAWARRLRRHRRSVAAALTAAAVLALGTTLRPPPAPTTAVLVAQHDLVPGDPVSDADVALERRPASGVPADALTSPGDVLRRTVAFPVRAGEALSARHVVSGALLAALGPGLVASTVTLADPAAAALVRPGDLVDILAAATGTTADGSGGTASGSTAYVVAARVRVLVPAASATAGSGGLLGGAPAASQAGSSLVLATTPEQALAVARAAVGARLSVAVRAG